MKAWDAVPTTTRMASNVRVSGPEETGWFDAQRATHHSPGAGHPVGDCLRQVVGFDGRVVARWVWGPLPSGWRASSGSSRFGGSWSSRPRGHRPTWPRRPNLLANPALIRNALLAVLPDLFPKDSLPETRENLRSRPARSLDLVAS
jgi:hypothetical protein